MPDLDEKTITEAEWAYAIDFLTRTGKSAGRPRSSTRSTVPHRPGRGCHGAQHRARPVPDSG